MCNLVMYTCITVHVHLKKQIGMYKVLSLVVPRLYGKAWERDYKALAPSIRPPPPDHDGKHRHISEV